MYSILNASRPHAAPASPASKPQGKAESEQHVHVPIVALVYLIKRVEREFHCGSLKLLMGFLLCVRLLGPYRLVKWLLAQVAFPMNLLAGVSHTFIGALLMHNHLYVFPPFLPLLPDALSHESQVVYITFGILLMLCGVIRLTYVVLGSPRGASSLIVCATWLAELAVFSLLLRAIPSFNLLDAPLAFGCPLLAIAATLCCGDVPACGWRLLIVRMFAVGVVVALLLYYSLVRILLQQGLISDTSALLDINQMATMLQSAQLRESALLQTLQAAWEYLQNLYFAALASLAPGKRGF